MKPTESHWKAAIKVLCYLKTTASMGIVLQKQNDNQKLFDLTVYADAAHGNQSDEKATTGYLCYFNGNLISWNTQKSKVVSNSTTESEVYAILEGSMELAFTQKLVYEILNINPLSTLYTDSTTAILTVTNQKSQGRAKHIRIKISYIKEGIDKKHFVLKWLDTKAMLADILTKYIPGQQFYILRDQILVNTKSLITKSSSSLISTYTTM